MTENPLLKDRLMQALKALQNPEAAKDFPELPKDWSSLSDEEREAFGERINDFFTAQRIAAIEARYDGTNPTREEQKKVERFLALFQMKMDEAKREREEDERKEIEAARQKRLTSGEDKFKKFREFPEKDNQVNTAPPAEPDTPPKPVAHPPVEVKPTATHQIAAKATSPPDAPAAVTPVPQQSNAAVPPATSEPKRKMLTFKVDEDVVDKMRHVVYFYGAKNQQHLLEGLLLQAIEEMEEKQRSKR